MHDRWVYGALFVIGAGGPGPGWARGHGVRLTGWGRAPIARLVEAFGEGNIWWEVTAVTVLI